MTTPLAAAIREARKTAGLTQVELARRLRVRQQTISDWETGRCIPGGAELAWVARCAPDHGLVIADVFRADAPREGETLAPTAQERADAIVNLYAYIESGPPPF